jgi:membrane protease YdiL (CAAX protease family)
MNQPLQHHSPWQSVGLHLIPGALLTVFYVLVTPLLNKAGFPAFMSLLLAILVILIPVELGILLSEGKKRTGKFTLNGVVLYQERISLWQYFFFPLVLVTWCCLVFVYLEPLDNYIIQQYFSWIPSWLTFSTSPEILSKYPPTAVKITIIAGFFLNGIAGPLVEELYFRGYLLPRIPAARMWAPAINILLFSLYHFFSPWQNITRILAFMPMVYVVSWKRNIYLSMITHCTGNILGMLPLISLLISN